MANPSFTSTRLITKVSQLVLSEQEKFIQAVGVGLFGRIHIPLVVKLSKQLLKTHPEADKNITILGAWLHDSGHIWGGSYPEKVDHAVTGEAKIREILNSLHTDSELIEKVAHIVRSHRNRDISPATIEAKIVAAADSGAHFYGGTYEKILNQSKGSKKENAIHALEKLERDWRDVSVFPELAEELKSKYEKSKKLLTAVLSEN